MFRGGGQGRDSPGGGEASGPAGDAGKATPPWLPRPKTRRRRHLIHRFMSSPWAYRLDEIPNAITGRASCASPHVATRQPGRRREPRRTATRSRLSGGWGDRRVALEHAVRVERLVEVVGDLCLFEPQVPVRDELFLREVSQIQVLLAQERPESTPGARGPTPLPGRAAPGKPRRGVAVRGSTRPAPRGIPQRAAIDRERYLE